MGAPPGDAPAKLPKRRDGANRAGRARGAGLSAGIALAEPPPAPRLGAPRGLPDSPAVEPPRLIVVLDTEEEFDWDAEFDRAATSVAHMPETRVFQELCEAYGIRPVYMADYPVATREPALSVLRPLIASGRAILGAHLHPWVCPPFEEEVNRRNSFPGNLPPALERAKIAALQHALEAAYGVRPEIYKAGRYGIGPNTFAILEELGFTIDLSPAPPEDFTREGGPDFVARDLAPRWEGPGGSVLSIPSTGALVGWAASPSLQRWLSATALSRRLRLRGIAARLRAIEGIKLSPEGHTAAELLRFVRALIARGQRLFVLSLHSPSLAPGLTPYARTIGERDALLASLQGFFQGFFGELGGVPTDPFAERAAWLARTAPAIRVGPVPAIPPPAPAAPVPLPARGRVLHLLMFGPPDFSGEAVFLARSSARMRQLAPGVEHHLLVTRTPRPAEMPTQRGGLSRIIYPRRAADSPIFAYLRYLGWMVWNLRRYDAVHFRTHLDWYGLSYLLARLYGRRILHSATLDDTIARILARYHPLLRPYAARMLRLFHGYVAISPKLLAETVDMVPEGRAHLLPCGIEAPPQPPEARARIRALLGAAEGEPLLVTVGGLCARKDQGFLIAALPALLPRHPGLRLVLVGPAVEPSYAAGLCEQAATLGLADRVIFAGAQDDPHPWYAAADVMVFASREEGFGTVVPEAMAHGLPVVARRLPGVNDWFLRDDQTGLLFEDAPGFVTALERVLGDPALRARLGAAAQAEARARFDMERIARRYLELYGMG